MKNYTEAEQDLSESDIACIDTYNDYTEDEIANAPIPCSIANAWGIGKEIKGNA